MRVRHVSPAIGLRRCALLLSLTALVVSTPARALYQIWTQSDWSGGNYEWANNTDGIAQPGILILRNRLDDMRFFADPADWQGIYSMSVYHDSLFLAMSDYPFSYDGADIRTYDYRSGQFDLSYQPYESGVLVTKIFGDTLYVPGPDSMDPWYDFGSIYMYNGHVWIEKDAIPTAVHVCDVEVCNGVVYASTGHATGSLDGCGCVWASYDWGDSWTRVLTITPNQAHPVRRFFGLGHHGDRVFAQPDGFPPEDHLIYTTTNGVDWDPLPVPSMPIDKHMVFTAWGDSTLFTIHNRLYIWNGTSLSQAYMLPWDGWRWDRGIVRYKGDLYGGGLDCHIYRWVQGAQWTLIGPVGLDPSTEEIESMAIYCGRLFLGTSRRTLDQTGHLYVSAAMPNGSLVSLPYDFASTIASGTLSWEDCRPSPENTTRFRLRSGRTIEEMRQHQFVGPDGTTATWYIASGTPIASIHAGDRYVQYMAELLCPMGLLMPFLDRITLEVWTEDPTGVDGPVAGVGATGVPDLRLVFPSPVRAADGIEMWVQLAAPSVLDTGVELQVNDAAGRLLRTAQLALGTSGAVRWNWDLKDAVGHRMPAGVYWTSARLARVPSPTTTRSLVIVP